MNGARSIRRCFKLLEMMRSIRVQRNSFLHKWVIYSISIWTAASWNDQARPKFRSISKRRFHLPKIQAQSFYKFINFRSKALLSYLFYLILAGFFIEYLRRCIQMWRSLTSPTSSLRLATGTEFRWHGKEWDPAAYCCFSWQHCLSPGTESARIPSDRLFLASVVGESLRQNRGFFKSDSYRRCTHQGSSSCSSTSSCKSLIFA